MQLWRRRASGFIACQACAAAALLSGATAQDAPERPTWNLRAFGELKTPDGHRAQAPLSFEEEKFLAEMGEPMTTAVSRVEFSQNPDRALRRAVDERCGKERPDPATSSRAQAYLYNQVKQLNADAQAVLSQSDGEFIKIKTPFCLRLDRNKPFTVRNNDAFSFVLNRYVYGSEINHYALFYAANKKQIDEKIGLGHIRTEQGKECKPPTVPQALVNCVRTWPGEKYQLHEASYVTSFVLKEGVSEAAFDAGKERLGPSLKDQFRERRVTEPLRFVGLDFAADADCSTSNAGSSDDYPFNVDLVHKRFQIERAKRAAALGDSHQLLPVRIGMIDAGVEGAAPGAGSSFFPPKLFIEDYNPDKCRRISGELVCPTFYGTDLYKHLGGRQTTPIPADGEGSNAEKYHGSRVANLIFGGAAFRSKVIAADPPPIAIHIYNVAPDAAAKSNRDLHGPAIVNDALIYLTGNLGYEPSAVRTQIINISLEQPNKKNGTFSFLKNDKGVLHVVAAGNSRTDLDDKATFPAAFGGRKLSQVITVAAHDEAYRKAPFSSYSSNYVDVAAPGCRVAPETLASEENTKSGTSYAAPLVTFTASLMSALRAESEIDPPSVKYRISYAASFPEEHGAAALTSHVSLGAALDIVRAISLRSDVLTINGARTYRFGDHAGDSTLVRTLRNICNGVDGDVYSQSAKRFIFRRRGDGNEFEVDRLRAPKAVGADKENVHLVNRSTCVWTPKPEDRLPFTIADSEAAGEGRGDAIDLLAKDRFDILLKENCSTSQLC